MQGVSDKRQLKAVLSRGLVFVAGKGGVGKTFVSRSLSQALRRSGRKVLWVGFEDPLRPPGELRQVENGVWELNCDATQAFEEYAALKIGLAPLVHLFFKNRLIRFLARAAPGIHELVLLGKVWYERRSYDHVIVDLPSTGYGLAMFQSVRNFTRLFRGGAVLGDAQAMLDTFEDPKQTGFVLVSLPEEMPLQESLELGLYLSKLFPRNPLVYIANRCFPKVETSAQEISHHAIPQSGTDYVIRRSALEQENLKLWEQNAVKFQTLPFETDDTPEGTIQTLGGWLE